MKVRKREGSLVDFDKQKIINAISKAGYVKDEIKEKIADSIEKNGKEEINIEEIQDLVEKKLMASSYKSVAQEYVRYRFARELLRNSTGASNEIIEIVNLKNQDAQEENSNKNPIILSTQRDYIAGAVSKELSAKLLLPEDILKAHNDGIIHVHDMDYLIQHMHNCFDGNTRFVTNKGIKCFKSFRDGEKIEVLDKDGNWRTATVKKYGKQQMFEVVLKSRKQKRKVVCTANHRWILKDGSVTTNLVVGDSLLPIIKQDFIINSVRETEMFCFGFVIGDGCDRDNGFQVRLCGDKTKYLSLFSQAGYRVNDIKDSEDVCCSYITEFRKQEFLSNKAWKYLSTKDKIALFNGYYTADGCTDRDCIFTSDERVLEMIRDISALAGYHIFSEKEIIRDTKFKKNALIHKVKFITHQTYNTLWTVESIKQYRAGYYEQDAWCVEEPVTKSFTLESGIITGNCCLVNLEDILQNGTVINGTMIEKPHSFSTACNIATQVMAQVASNQYGGQSETLSHLAPFVDISRKKIFRELLEEMDLAGLHITEDEANIITEKRLRDEIKRGVQTMQYQINTLMTSNGQTPFVTIFMYLNEVDESLKHDLAMIIEEVVRQRYQGTKNESGVYVSPAFPKLIYVLEEDNITPDGKYYYLTKLCAKCSAKRLVPDYLSEKMMLANKKDEDGKGYCYPPMGCRSLLSVYNDKAHGGRNKGKFYGRFNMGVVTINLVDVGLSANKNIDKFWEILEERLELCHRALRVRYQNLKGTSSDVSPIHWQYGALARLKKHEVIDELLHGGYSTISLGYAGLYECVKAMTGKSHTDQEAKPFALSIMRRLTSKCEQWKAEENIGYSVYGTPIESTTYKFAKCLKNRFGIIEGITDHDYITNSYHVNVREKIDPFQKLEFESDFQLLSAGGAISYIESVNLENNIEAVMAVLRYIYDHIVYAEINTKSDYCMVCGYDKEIKIVNDEKGRLAWECPCCGNRDQSKMNVTRRTCGYLGSQYWNQGRTEEIKDRFVHLGGDL